MNITKKILRPHQRKMVEYGRNTQHPRFFVEMRLGKTLATIRTILTYPPSHRQRILVVAPFSAWDGWDEELTNENIPHLLLYGSSEKRIRSLHSAFVDPPEHQFYITNYESFRGIGEALANVMWDVVVLDESDSIKNPQAKVTKYYTKYFKHVRHRFILTGTPDPENDLNFFSQLQFSDPSIFSGMNFWQFKSKWCCLYGFNTVIRPNLKTKYHKILADNCYFLKYRDAGIITEHIIEHKMVEFDAPTKKIYKQLADTFILGTEEDGRIKDTMNAAVAYEWMRQLASGFADGKLVWDGKVKELIRLLTGDLQHEQVVVWASHIAEIKMLKEVLSSKKVTCREIYGATDHDDRSQARLDFQAKKFRVLIANPEVCKYGMDLSVSSTQIFYSLPLSGKTYEQAIARTINIATNPSALIIFLLAKGTIDKHIATALIKKEYRTGFNYMVVRSLLKESL